jgi:hypothetical protein
MSCLQVLPSADCPQKTTGNALLNFGLGAGDLGGHALCVTLRNALAVESPSSHPHPLREFDNRIPTRVATRVGPAEAPAIDGDPWEAIWQKAQALDEVCQLEPRPGRRASETTVARFLYDDNLYVRFTPLIASLKRSSQQPARATAMTTATTRLCADLHGRGGMAPMAGTPVDPDFADNPVDVRVWGPIPYF